MTDLLRVQPGQSVKQALSAQAWNRLVDSANWVDEQRTVSRLPAGFEEPRRLIVRVLNATEDPVDRYGILGLDGPIITPDADEGVFLEEITFRGVAPLVPDHQAKFGVLIDPLAAGEIGRAILDGLAIVRLDVQSEGHRYAEVAASQTDHLQSAACASAQILWTAPAGSEEDGAPRWAIVRLGLPPGGECIFELTASLGPGGHAAAVFCEWNGTTWAATSETLVVYDAIDTFSGSSGQQGLARLDAASGRWVIWQLRC